MRVLLWHQNNVLVNGQQKTVHIGAFLSNGAGSASIQIAACNGIKALNTNPGTCLNLGIQCLMGTMPQWADPNFDIGIGQKIGAGIIDRLFEDSVPFNTFRGALIDLTISPFGASGGLPYNFSLVSAIDLTNITTRTGIPVAIQDCFNPADNAMVGHARGSWDQTTILVPGFGLDVANDPTQFVQITLGQSLCTPYGEDINLYLGETAVTPVQKTNKAMYGVNQQVRVPVYNPYTSAQALQAYLVGLGNQGVNVYFNAGLNLPGTTPAVVHMPYALTNAVQVINMTVPPTAVAELGFDMQVAPESVYPIGLFVNNAGTTTSTTTTSTTTTTTTTTSTTQPTTTTPNTTTSQTTCSTTTTTTTTTSSTTTSTGTSSTTTTGTGTTTSGTTTTCLTGDALVNLWGGGAKHASEVAVGDGLIGITGDGLPARQVVAEVFEGEEACFRITTDAGTVECSGSHQLLTQGGIPVAARNLREGDHWLTNGSGCPVRVLLVERVDARRVYGWCCEPDHVFLACGVIHHNKKSTVTATVTLAGGGA